MSKRVLIITYYWPPSGGSGVQRWLKFAKYLPEFGWQPVVYTPANPNFPFQDESLLEDIPESCVELKRDIWEPYQLASLFFSPKKANAGVIKGDGDPSLKARVMKWVRGNIFVPDPRVYWVKPSIKYLTKYLKDNPVDAIVTTGPPHSMHLIGLGLKRKLGLFWIADFRDPMAKLDFMDIYSVTKYQRKKYESLESQIVTECDQVLGTSFSLPKSLMPFDPEKFNTITNGFDQEDFEDTPTVAASNHFTVFHAGILHAYRNSNALWQAIADKCVADAQFKAHLRIHLVGVIDDDVEQFLINHPVLKDHVKIEGYQGHKTILKYYQTASLLLLLVNNSHSGNVAIPGKLFEYLALRKPILALGGLEADAFRIIKEVGAGTVSEYEDQSTIARMIDEQFTAFLEKKEFSPNQEKINRYARKNLTAKLVDLLDKR